MKRKPEATDQTEDQPHSTRVKTLDIGPSSSLPPPSPPGKSSDPEYGSQAYWEKRYTSNKNSNGDQLDSKTDGEGKADKGGNDDVSLGHEWYFTYVELKNLILPLVLGGRGEEFELSDDDDENNGDRDEGESDIWEEVEVDSSDKIVEADGDGDESSPSRTKVINDRENGIEDEYISKDDEEASNDDENVDYEIYKAIANDNCIPPKKVLEIGCGDVPLGRGLCEDLLHFQSVVGANASHVIEQIICFDYSKNVIDLLINQQNLGEDNNTEVDNKDNLAVKYEVLDARNLPFKERHFDLIMDKGTLDAMLSDKNEGVQNCVKIIAESSRLLVNGGYFLLVSHLNACNSEGLSWVDEVLITGLRNGDKISDWRIEVHSGDNDNEVSDREDGEKDFGPAVYIIQKISVSDDKAKMREMGRCESKASIKFFGY